MQTFARIVVVLLCQFFTASIAYAAAKSDAPPQTLAELKSRLTTVLQQAHVPGAGVALFDRSGEIWAGGLGYADLSSKKPVTANTQFRVGSITKSFVAVALLQLAEQGKLDLNARLRDIAPEIPVTNPWEASDPITIAEVLEHTAGFDDMHFKRLYNFHDDPEIPLRTVIERSSPELHVRWRPGSRASYSNVDYLVAGYLLEKLTGKPYETYVTEHVLIPLDMAHASLILDTTTIANLAQGYEGSDQHAVSPVMIYLRPAGALNSSPLELAHLGVMLLNRGTWQGKSILTAASVTRMETPKTSDAAKLGLSFGYGLANYPSYMNGYEFHGHDGGIDGFISRYAYAPDLGVGYVLLVNSGNPGKSLREARQLIVSYLTRAMPKPVITPAPRVSASTMQELSGYYREENPRNQVIAVADYLLGIGSLKPDGKGGLVFKNPFEADALLPAGPGLWRDPDDTGADSIAYTSTDGARVLYVQPNTGGAWFVKVGWLSAYGPLLLVCITLLLMLSTILFLPVWIVRMIMGRMRNVQHWSVRILPLAASAMFLLMIASILTLEPIQLGIINLKTMTFFVASLLFAILSAASLVQALRALRWNVNPWVRWHSLSVSLGCSGLVMFLSTWGLIGLRLWNF